VIWEMTSPYLQQPLFSLSVALPQMLEKIEAKLANEKLEAAEEERLRRRAELIRWLLVPRPITQPATTVPGGVAAPDALVSF
jgi:hypothetical protein